MSFPQCCGGPSVEESCPSQRSAADSGPLSPKRANCMAFCDSRVCVELAFISLIGEGGKENSFLMTRSKSIALCGAVEA